MHSRLMRRGATLAILGLLVTAGAHRAQAAPAVAGPDALGIYHGFFQSSATQGLWGNLVFSISEVRNRRWTGMVDMIIPTGASPIELPFAVNGTIAASGEFTGGGKSSNGMMVEFHGQIMLVDGGAAVADATYRLSGPGIQSDNGTATLLRDFTGGVAPFNLNGAWDGTYMSAGTGGTGTVHLDVSQACAANQADAAPAPDPTAVEFENSFTGQEVVTAAGTDHALTFIFRGTLAGDGRFVAIGWDVLNDRFVKTGVFIPSPDPNTAASLSAMYTVMFGNGTTDQGSFMLTQQLYPPNPCAIGTAGQ